MTETITPVREGSRWRHSKPSTDEVTSWFGSVPIDDGMARENFISGVVLIPASEKVKRKTDRGTTEDWELTFTPYVRVDTRISYFRKLAELRDLIAVIEPVEVPRCEPGEDEMSRMLANAHMPSGYWWHVVKGDSNFVRYLCCTMRVALYHAKSWFDSDPKIIQHASAEVSRPQITELRPPRPLREGVATKQVPGGPDVNGLARAETGAVGRALGMAGILVVGTGVATADDMAELQAPVLDSVAALPEPGAPEDSEEVVNARLMELQALLRPHEAAWSSFAAWWDERQKEGGWKTITEAPIEVRKGTVRRMEQHLRALDSSSEASDAAPSD